MVTRASAIEVSRLRLPLRAREAPVRVTDRSVLREIEPIVRVVRERKETWAFIAQTVEAAGVRKQNGSSDGRVPSRGLGAVDNRPAAAPPKLA